MAPTRRTTLTLCVAAVTTTVGCLSGNSDDGDTAMGTDDSDTATPTRTASRPLTITGDWPAAYHDAQNSASTSNAGPRERGEVYWRTRALGGPSIGDGRLYVATESTRAEHEVAIVGLDPRDGSTLWESTPGIGTYLPPTYHDGTVYAMSGRLTALDAATGELRWAFELPNQYSSAPIVKHGRVYVTNGSADDPPSAVFALDATTGDVDWRRDLDGTIRTSAGVTNRLVVVATEESKVHALDVADGTTRWTLTLGGIPRTPPVIGRYVHILDTDGALHTIDRDGTVRWTSPVSDGRREGGLALADSLVLATAADGVTALRAEDGSTEWSSSTSAFGPPAVDTEAVYFTSGNRGKRLHTVDVSNGTDRWNVELAGDVSKVADERIQSPPIVVDGGVFVAAGRTLVAVGPTAGG